MVTAPPSHTIIDTSVCDDEVSLTLMCNRVRFIVTVSLQNLRLEAGAEASNSTYPPPDKQFRDFLEDLNDPCVMENFENWAIEPCISFLQSLAPKPASQSFTLQAYFEPHTVSLTLVNIHGRIEARQKPIQSSMRRALSSNISIQDLRMRFGRRINHLQLFKGSDLDILYAAGSIDEEYCLMPKIVNLKGKNRQFFFKAAVEGDSFRREVDALLRIRNLNSIEVRVPKILGLVEWSDSSSVMGMLLEVIIHRCNLREAIDDGASSLQRKKWMQQVRATLLGLHSAGIVWGDVKPENDLIDKADNAVVVDFGGGYSPDFVDEHLSETFEGDLQGLSRLENYIVSARNANNEK